MCVLFCYTDLIGYKIPGAQYLVVQPHTVECRIGIVMIEPPLPNVPSDNPTKVARIMAAIWPNGIDGVSQLKVRNLT